MNEALLNNHGLLVFLGRADLVLAGLDVKRSEGHTLGTVGRGEDPALVQYAATAHVHQRQDGWEAPLEGYLVRELAPIGVAATHDAASQGLDRGR